eukprot:Em0002g1754a
MATASSKQAHHHTSRPTPPSGTHGASHTQVLGPRLWWRALCQGLAMCCISGPVISTTNSKLTPLYEQQAHTILRLANSHHSTKNEHTPLYKQRAHTTLRPYPDLIPKYEFRTLGIDPYDTSYVLDLMNTSFAGTLAELIRGSTSIYLNDVLLGSIKHLVHYLADKLHLLSGYRFSTTMPTEYKRPPKLSVS